MAAGSSKESEDRERMFVVGRQLWCSLQTWSITRLVGVSHPEQMPLGTDTNLSPASKDGHGGTLRKQYDTVTDV